LTVSYWTNRSANEPPHVEDVPGFKTVPFTPIFFRLCGREYWFNLDLIKYLMSNRQDVIIGPAGMFCKSSIISKLTEILMTIITKVRFIYRMSCHLLPGVEHHVAPTGLRKVWYRILYKNVIVTTYSQRAADIVKSQGCSVDRLFVDYNSMDSDELIAIRSCLENSKEAWISEFLQHYGIQNNGFVLFASRISPEKRLDILIEAWKQVIQQRNDVQLVVVGSGTAKMYAQQQAKNITNRVVFVEGIYNTEELAKFYYLADLVVFPGFATLSTYFAMCFNKPVISSQYGNEAEYVMHNINGYQYSYGDVNMLVEMIITLLDNPELRNKFGSESENIIRKKINMQHMLETFRNAVYSSFQ
jgi:glycosyltransferase involved in cell wall biosynthesis